MPLIEARRRKPGDDMISAMATAEVGGERLSDLEILATCNMMATAGGGTSRSAIAMSLWWLHQFPDELAKLKAHPKLIDLAAEEFLRFDAPTQRGIRTARQDFRIGGKEIRKGQILHIMIGAANRDPDQFEEPDRLSIARSPNRHVSLGHGVHYCLGAALARLELAHRAGELPCSLSRLSPRQRQDHVHGPYRQPPADQRTGVCALRLRSDVRTPVAPARIAPIVPKQKEQKETPRCSNPIEASGPNSSIRLSAKPGSTPAD